MHILSMTIGMPVNYHFDEEANGFYSFIQV
jgi:hypothetical protein